MAVFIMEYRVKGYQLSDAMRPDPKWGKKIFNVSSDALGTDDIEVVRTMAATPESTPKGFEFFSIYNRDVPNSLILANPGAHL